MTTTTHSKLKLLLALELSNSKWLLGFDNGEKIRRKTIDAGDRGRLLQELKVAKQKLGYTPDEPVLCCYEAGRDGFWIYRWLFSEGIECIIVDPASIEVQRHKKRSKTDRLDVESLLRQLRRYENGDKKVWAVLCVPEEQAEDEMRLAREMQRLKKERASHTNRIKGLLKLHGISAKGRLSKLDQTLSDIRLWNGKPLPPALKAEIKRELMRLKLLEDQLKDLEALKESALKRPVSNADHQYAQLMKLKGVGSVSAWLLAKEFFGWRTFDNRKKVAAMAGLTPTPYNSGSSITEQGISKQGNKRVRSVMVELAWTWMRFQPESPITHWYIDRYAKAGSRMRRIGLVAVARKLLVALWKYIEFDEIPEGAIVK